MAKAGYTARGSGSKRDKVVSHGIRRSAIQKLRYEIFKFGEERAPELETMFWLVVKARLLRHTLALNMKAARPFYQKAARVGKTGLKMGISLAKAGLEHGSLFA